MPNSIVRSDLNGESSLELSAGNAATETVAAETDATGEAVEQVVEGKAKLPPAVRARVDELFGLLEQSKQAAAASGRSWTKLPVDKSRMIEVAGLLYEYGNQIPELQINTGTPAASVRKYLNDQRTALSEVEEQVVLLLTDKCAKTLAERADTTKQIKREDRNRQNVEILSLLRLMRKKSLSTEDSNAFMKEHGMNPTTVSFLWEKKNRNENEMPRLTEDLIPEIFAQARNALEPAVDNDNDEPEDDEPKDKNTETEHDTGEVDETIPRKKSDDATTRTGALLEPSAPITESVDGGLDTSDRTLIGELATQNRLLIAFLMSAQPDDARLRLMTSMLEVNNVIMGRLTGTPQTSGSAFNHVAVQFNGTGHNGAPGIRLHGNRVSLPPGVKGTLEIIETKITLNGSNESTAVEEE